MRIRSLAGLTLLSLQALVAMRPFAALPDASASVSSLAAHHVEPVAADPPCHHAAPPASTDVAPADVAPATDDQRTPAPAHDHESSACHAGTPCCAPTLPVAETTVPFARATAVAAKPLAPRVWRIVADTDRRLPPATAPPALS